MVIIMACGGGLAVILLGGVIFVAARSGSSKKKGSRSDGRAEMFEDGREKELLSFEALRSPSSGGSGSASAPRANPMNAPTRSALQSVGIDG
jgi:hypothetical protein